MEMFVLFLSLSFMKYNVLKTLCGDVIVFSQDVLGIISPPPHIPILDALLMTKLMLRALMLRAHSKDMELRLKHPHLVLIVTPPTTP